VIWTVRRHNSPNFGFLYGHQSNDGVVFLACRAFSARVVMIRDYLGTACLDSGRLYPKGSDLQAKSVRWRLELLNNHDSGKRGEFYDYKEV